MKKIVVGVVLLLLVLVVAPWGIGKVAEQRINAGLDRAVAELPYMKIVERKWTGGWFRSEQEVTFELFGDLYKAIEALKKTGETSEAPPIEADLVDHIDENGESAAMKAPSADVAAHAAPADEDAAAEAPEAPEVAPVEPMKPIRFTVRNEILHGPVLWPASLGIARVNTKVVLDEKIRKEIMEFFGTDEPVRITSRVGFFGGGSVRFSGEGRKLAPMEGHGTISYDDFRLDVSYSGKFDDVDADGQWPRLEATDTTTGGTLVIQDMTLKSTSKRVRGDLFDTDGQMGIGKISFTDSQKNVTSVEGLHYVGNTDFKDEFITAGVQAGTGQVVSKDLAQAKLDIREIHYDFTLRRLHAESLEKMMGAFKEMYSKPLASAGALDAAVLEPMKKYGLALLTYDPEFAIDRMGIVTPEGEGVLKGVIRLKGAKAEDFGDNPMALVMKVDADLTFEVAQKLLEKIPNGATAAGMAVDQGFAKREGEKLVSHITFKQAKLSVNGKEVPLPGLGAGPTQPTVHQE